MDGRSGSGSAGAQSAESEGRIPQNLIQNSETNWMKHIAHSVEAAGRNTATRN